MGTRTQETVTERLPRYIECKLDKYTETLLEGINKDSVDLKWNYDATEKEPIILPSMIPNILVNLRMSISVSEANKMPSHNLKDVCDSITTYLETRDINKAIEVIKCPDLPSFGSIIYDRETFESIYKTGKGSFINLGRYVYDEKKRIVKIIEIPYTTYIENIYDEIEKNFDKFENEVEDFHNGSDRNGVSLELYLKKSANVDVVINKLRKYTSFESKFSCNFTILDLDGKTPKLCSLEDIITMWITHRIKCIRRELKFDLDKIESELHLLSGLESIIPYLEDIIKIIRGSKNKSIAIETISSKYNLDEKQSEYVVSIRLINLTQDYIQDKLKTIEGLKTDRSRIVNTLSDNKNIEDIIKEQLEMVKSKFGKDRLTEIIYDDKQAKIDISNELIEDYNCRILLTKNFIKKHLKQSNNHKIATEDEILCDISSNNKDTIMLFTNLGNRYKIRCCDLKTVLPSTFGQPIKDLIPLEQGEKVIDVASIQDEVGYMVFVYENGKISKINIDKYINNYTKIKNCYSTESPLVGMKYIRKDVNILCISNEGKALIINTSEINAKSTKNASGNIGIKVDDAKVMYCIVDVKTDDVIEITTEKGKVKEFMMDDIAPTGKSNEERRLFEYLTGKRGNKGNFLVNVNATKDSISKITKIKKEI